ncbi:MAG: C4-type zinc ribbon domain-containing protein [Kofleriaceae bacterium]
MKDQLLLLLELQSIDVKVKELDLARKALPKRTDPLRNDLAKLEAMLEVERQKVAESEAWKKQQQALITREQELLRAAKSKLQGTRTGKEFHAATREVEFKTKSIKERDAEVKKVTEALATSTTVLAERDEAIQRLRDQLAAEDAQVATLLEEMDAQIATVGAGRDALRERIEPTWRKAYDALIVRGLAVAEVDGGTCQGCRVRIPPQLNNKLARLESIETCERCARIIYRKEMLEPPPAAADAPAAE